MCLHSHTSFPWNVCQDVMTDIKRWLYEAAQSMCICLSYKLGSNAKLPRRAFRSSSPSSLHFDSAAKARILQTHILPRLQNLESLRSECLLATPTATKTVSAVMRPGKPSFLDFIPELRNAVYDLLFKRSNAVVFAQNQRLIPAKTHEGSPN